MPNPNVLIVPETEDFVTPVSHEGKVWISLKLGEPRLEANDARYVAPYWLKDDSGANRIYHILDSRVDGNATEIALGNSFVLSKRLTGLTQRRVFSYKRLSEFGMVEIRDGLLMEMTPAVR